MQEIVIRKQVNYTSSILCPGHTRTVVGLACSDTTPDGVFFVSACLDENSMLRNGITGDWVGSFVGHDGAIWSACINKSATRVISGSADFTSKIWDATTGKLLHTFPDKHIVKAVSISDDSCFVAAGGKSKGVYVYSILSYQSVLEYDFQEDIAFLQFCPISTRNSHLLCIGCSGKLVLLNISDVSNPVIKSIQLTDIVLDVSVSNDYIVIASNNGVRFLSWELETISKKDYPYHIRTCSLNSDHSHYLISDVNTITEVEYDTHQPVAIYNGHHGTVCCLRYIPGTECFVSGSDDSSIRMWTIDRETA